jgi:VIT1/CCC1 family predicted Fe2+/Mn2+ transporter
MAYYLQQKVRDSPALGIVDMVRRASHKKNRIAMIAGFILGGWVPIVTYLVGHRHVQELPTLWLLVAGGLTYSAMTVFSWAKIAFRHPLKALGFVVLLEGAMTFVPDRWIGLPSLGLLILINGLATGTNLVDDSFESRVQGRGKRHDR